MVLYFRFCLRASLLVLPHSHHLVHFLSVDSATSLVPRPFPPPVFDRILYAKTEGEGLGERVTCVTSGRREGRHRGGRCPIVVTHKLCVDQPRVYRTTKCIDTVFRMTHFQVLEQNITGRTSRFFVRHRPPSVYPHVYLTSRT